MNATLGELLHELERFGAEHDARESEHARRMLNITADTGPLLALLVRATRARHILELGTSNGYSTIWLADAAREVDGEVTTVERSSEKIAMARANFSRAGLDGMIRIVESDAGDALRDLADASVDFLFLDSQRERYVQWWPEIVRVLAPGGLIVADNATSHAADFAPFIEMVQRASDFSSVVVPLGNGELLVHRSARARASSDPAPYTLRPHRPGDMGWIIHRQAILYHREFGWNEEYESLTARIMADFLDHYDPKLERCWIAECEGEIVGSVFVVKHPERAGVAKLRLLYVEPSARGLGIGRRLVREVTDFARAAGYHTLMLWTNSVLASARRIYEAEGYRLVSEERGHIFGKELVSQNWEKAL